MENGTKKFSKLRFELRAALLMSQLRKQGAKSAPIERKPAKTSPHSSAGEAARRARQIARGQLTSANGLVWPGQLISRPDGKLYLQRPYC